MWPTLRACCTGPARAAGSAREYRVVWFAQMLTDECIDSNADTDTCTRQDTLQLLHTYDESWSLTGLAVREGTTVSSSTSSTRTSTRTPIWRSRTTCGRPRGT